MFCSAADWQSNPRWTLRECFKDIGTRTTRISLNFTEESLKRLVLSVFSVNSVYKDVAPRDANVEPRDAEVEPRDANVEPRDVNVKPRDVNVKPRDASVKPRDFSFKVVSRLKSQFPAPYSQIPIHYSLFPNPNSQFPNPPIPSIIVAAVVVQSRRFLEGFLPLVHRKIDQTERAEAVHQPKAG